MKKVSWEKFRRTQFDPMIETDAVVIVPVASVEQHAEHLPINTDTNICYRIAIEAAQRIEDVPVVVLPPIWTGYSPHHMSYPGSITLKFHTFVEVLTQIAISVHAHGFKKILFLNGHGGNSPIVQSMQRKLAAEQQITVFSYDYWNLPSVPEEMRRISESDKGGIGHSGEIETSFQLYLQPELVDETAARWVSGARGDPSFGSRAKGESLFTFIVDALIKVLRDYHSGKLEETLKWQKEILD
ncbi:MAG: creatininase family protein [Deltaproteobacteria bacterium]|nr:creatininase family protein [Deltaproteobacteria bacterium]MBW2150288.1 creatininase family protein [Deltaproteobacteria bacterium]